MKQSASAAPTMISLGAADLAREDLGGYHWPASKSRHHWSTSGGKTGAKRPSPLSRTRQYLLQS
jgi:hypothetical protein